MRCLFAEKAVKSNYKVASPRLFFLFVNDLSDALEELTLLFVDHVKMGTRGTQNMNLNSSLTATWGWSKKWDLPINPAKCNYLTIGREVPLGLFFLTGPGTPMFVSKLVKDLGV